MRNPNNKITVLYPNGALRTRNCQSTVCPTKAAIGIVTDINEWYRYLAFKQDTQYNAHARFDAELAGEILLQDAWEIINHQH